MKKLLLTALCAVGFSVPAIAQSPTRYIPAQSSNGTILYRSHSYTNLSDFTIVGTAPTLNSVGQIVFSSTSASATGQQLVLSNAGTTTDSENWTFEVTVQLGTVGSSSNQAGGYGFVLARKSVNPNAQQGMLLNYYTTANGLSISRFDGSNLLNALAGSTIVGTPAVGDLVTLVFAQRGQTLYGIAQDITSGAVTTVSWMDNTLNGTGGVLPNTSQFAMLTFGGTYTMQSMRVVERSAMKPNLCIAGDSKTAGLGSGGNPSRWANMLDLYGPVDVFSGGGDYTAQILTSLPVMIQKGCKTLLLAAPFYNAVGFNIPTATWQADYSSIVSQAKAAGMRVLHMLSIPTSSGANVTAANAWVNSTFGSSGAGDTIIDPSVNFVAGTGAGGMNYTDGIHVNALGNAVVAADILTQSGLPVDPNAPYYFPPSPLALYSQP